MIFPVCCRQREREDEDESNFPIFSSPSSHRVQLHHALTISKRNPPPSSLLVRTTLGLTEESTLVVTGPRHLRANKHTEKKKRGKNLHRLHGRIPLQFSGKRKYSHLQPATPIKPATAKSWFWSSTHRSTFSTPPDPWSAVRFPGCCVAQPSQSAQIVRTPRCPLHSAPVLRDCEPASHPAS